MFLSVILCAHNPRRDYLRRTMASLDLQTLPRQAWEALLIDNGSAPALTAADFGPVAAAWRIVREEQLGLIRARIRGIRESKGDFLVFVDDDNILAPDYLEKVKRLAEARPRMGILSASTTPEYEVTPPSGIELYERFLAIRPLREDIIGRSVQDNAFPIGAGMAMRREVAARHVEVIEKDADGLSLGRKGNSLLAGEDTDFGYTALALGYEMGAFQDLKLAHLIPARRLRPEYLEKLAEDVTYSLYFLLKARGYPAPSSRWLTLKRRLALLAYRFHPNRGWARYRSAEIRGKLRGTAS